MARKKAAQASNVFDATKAAQIAKDVRVGSNEFEHIIFSIEIAAKNGENHIDAQIKYDETIHALEERGFTVMTINMFRQSYWDQQLKNWRSTVTFYRISW